MCKKLLVLSDTHGSVAALASVLTRANDFSPDAAVFLGDGFEDLDAATASTGFFRPWQKVRGNNDYGVVYQETGVFDFAGRRFFICHGHRFNMYRGMDLLINAARNHEADVALFGHTHVPFFLDVGGLSLINPGSVGQPRSRAGATFAIIECPAEGPLKTEFLKIEQNGDVSTLSVSSSSAEYPDSFQG